MKKTTLILGIVLTLLALTILPTNLLANPGKGKAVGAVYIMSNADTGNEILAFDRHTNGIIEFSGAYPTGGLGTSGGLGNQRGLVLSQNNKWLLAVNAGSDEISVFRIGPLGLTLTDTVASGGIRPVSITMNKNLVYVLHAGGGFGGSDNITGFQLSPHGTLMPLMGSSRPLSGDSTGPAQIEFSLDGTYLAVTEKATNNIDIFLVDADGYADGPYVNTSHGLTPFGFSFGKNYRLFVSEAFGAQTDAGAVSSYEVNPDGSLTVIDPSVPNTETAPCWLVLSNDGRYAFTANTPSDSLSGYKIENDGSLTLLDANGRTGETGTGTNPIDIDFSVDGRYLYTLNSGDGTVGVFRMMADGSLEHLQTEPGLISGANGLAAR